MWQPYGTITCQGNRHPRARPAGLVLLFAVLAAPAGAAERPPLPGIDGDKHLGVATCAGSTCHGAGSPVSGSPIMGNEFLIWHRKDAHSKAYAVLRTEESQRIADRLGLGEATEADTCLDCHADNVPEEQRGRRFQISDGVGCEACHGGAEGWIESHASGELSHEENIANGLYPTDRPVPRTRLCMSCHYSHPESPMTHRIMGAGHPSLLFETDTFSLIRPRHHRVDADYRERKVAASAAETWAIGQAVAARTRIRQVREDLGRDGVFPELYYFDCRGCHHELGDEGWVSRPIVDFAPGTVRLEDATFRMLYYVLAELQPGLADRWLDALKNFHREQGSGVAAVREAAARMLELARTAEARLADARLDDGQIRSIAGRIVAAGRATGYADRGWSDQASMALAALVDTLSRGDALSDAELERARTELDELFDALASPYGHAPDKVRAVMADLEPVL